MRYWRYKVRKGYVILNPFLKCGARSHRVQWIMRNSPLINRGVPFFFEPWVNPDDFDNPIHLSGQTVWKRQSEIPTFWEVFSKFVKEFYRWSKRRVTDTYISDDGTEWRWNKKTETYQRKQSYEKPGRHPG